MKGMRKLIAVVLALTVAMTFGSMSAFAQTVTYTGTGATTDGKITVSNAAKGETYSIHKLFDATVGANGEVAYKGTIPDALKDYFEETSTGSGYVKAKAGATKTTYYTDAEKTTVSEKATDYYTIEMSDGLKTALKSWATSSNMTGEEVSADGSAVVFDKIPYGYYVVKTSQGQALVSVDSATKTATVVDKNTTEPTIQKKVKDTNGNWVEVTDANIGEQKEFKVDVETTNWYTPKNASEQKQIKQYIIGDDFDTNKFTLDSIDSVVVGTLSEGTFTEIDAITGKTAFPITIDWVDNAGKSKYANGAVIRVIYKAHLNDDAVIDVGNTSADKRGNLNTADVNWKYIDDSEHFGQGEDKLKDEAAVDTYAIALKKFNESGDPLANATFQFPFYVKETKDSNGNYVYAGTTSGTGLINSITTPNDGQITIVGVKAGTYSGIAETSAPDGYNKTTDTFSVTAVKISTTTTVTTTTKSWKIDADGNVTDLQENETAKTTTTYTNNSVAATAIGVINKTGSTLPSTGGIGTTIFYILGALLVVGCGIILIARRRSSANN